MVARVQAVERAVGLLEVLAAETEPMRLTDLSAALGLAKGTTHGLVQTLRDLGWVDQDADGRYLVGALLTTLGAERFDVNEMRSRALNWADALAARTGAAVHVGVFHDGVLEVAHHVFRPDGSPQQNHTGARRPLHATAMGKVLLAFDARVVRALDPHGLEGFTYRTVVDRSQLLRHLADVRDLGWAASVEEYRPGRAEIAAPIREGSGHVVAAVAVEGPVDSLCDTRRRPQPGLVDEVLAVGRAISRACGHGGAR
ncbi:MAG: IclR family transcriptional regulator [Marmoricola sp.]